MSAPNPAILERAASHLEQAAILLREAARSSEKGLQLLSESSKCPSVDTKHDSSIDATEFASIMNVDPRTIRRWSREGKAPKPTRVGNTLRWRRSVVDLWMKERAR